MAVTATGIARLIRITVVITVVGIKIAGESLKVASSKFFDQNLLALLCHD